MQTVKEIMDLTGLTRSAIFYYIKLNKLKGTQLENSQWIFNKTQVKAFLKKLDENK